LRSVQVLGLLLILFMSVASAAYAVPDRSLESEQRIASMEINQSAGNMTGDDYIIALMYAYINDTVNKNSINDPSRPNFRSVQSEAISKFGDYSEVYTSDKLDLELRDLMSNSTTRECYIEQGSKYCKGRYVKPDQGYIDGFLFNLFNKGKLSELIDEARNSSQARLKEEVHLEAVRREKEEKQLLTQQENAARQTALDAYYKNTSENYSTKIADLLNQSDLNEALNLSNESIVALVSPYSNIMMITQGDIYMRLGRYQDAIESYKSAQTDFKYSNESAEYKESVNQSFLENKWDRIADVKIGIANDKVHAQIIALRHNLKDAPDAKRLLAGHTDGKEYTVAMLNYTAIDPEYIAIVNLSAYNDIKTTDMTSYQESTIPVCIDIFGALFKDPKISYVFINLNTSYYDKFGHVLERPYMSEALDAKTATQIGDWAAFKQYVGTDVSKFEQVIDLKMI